MQPVLFLSCTSVECDAHWKHVWLQLGMPQLGTGTTKGLGDGASLPLKPCKGSVHTHGWARGARSALTNARSRRCCQDCGCCCAAPLMALGMGGKGELLVSGTYSSSYLCLLVVIGLCQLFFLPVSVTDASGIFPGHIHLAASFRC